MIMVLCLFVYAAAEWVPPFKTQRVGSTVKNQLKKAGSESNYEMDLYHFYEAERGNLSVNSQSKRFYR